MQKRVKWRKKGDCALQLSKRLNSHAGSALPCWTARWWSPSPLTRKRRHRAFTLVGARNLISCLGCCPTPAKASQLGTPKSCSDSTAWHTRDTVAQFLTTQPPADFLLLEYQCWALEVTFSNSTPVTDGETEAWGGCAYILLVPSLHRCFLSCSQFCGRY